MTENILYYGDNLDVLRRHIKDESVDLIYLDPPFKSNQDYNVLFAEKNGSQAAGQIRAFEDTWQWDQAAVETYHKVVEAGGRVSRALQAFYQLLGGSDVMAYLSMMAPRLVELHRVLKSTGSLYLHCDPAANHYLKLLLDAIFTATNFQNEIIWKRTSGHSDAQRCGNVHDTLLFYTKSQTYIWNESLQPYDPQYVEQYYRHQDPDGRRWMSGDLGASGLSGGGYNYEWKGIRRVWRCPKETMERLEKERRIYYTRKGFPRIKRYLDETRGLPLQDVWTDLQALRSWHAERLGYPTQKPEALLERIILASSNEEDVVLDPFCGCGTAVAVAHRLNRVWVGIDITHLAITLIKNRLRDAFGEKVASVYEVKGEPVSLPDAQTLAKDDPHQFQWWALGRAGARPIERKKGPDEGIDGRLYFHEDPRTQKTGHIIFSVKSGHIGVGDIRDLRGVIEREKAELGVLISLKEPTKKMRAEAASAGFYHSKVWDRKYPRLQILTIADLLDGKKVEYPPSRQVDTTFKKAPKAKQKQPEQKSLRLRDSKQ